MSDQTTSLLDESPPDITDVIVNLVLSFLAPMFLLAADGNINLARIAAARILEAHQAKTPSDLIPIAQIVAFGIAALGSLSLSMTAGLSVPMILRLRGNAKSSSRAAEQIRHALQQHSDDWEPPASGPESKQKEEQIIAAVADLQKRAAAALAETTLPTPAHAIPTAAPATQPPVASRATTSPAPAAARAEATRSTLAHAIPSATPATQPPAAPSATTSPAPPGGGNVEDRQNQAPAGSGRADDRQNQLLWANAFADVAAEIAAEIPGLPPLERRAASMRAAALNTSASALLSGNVDARLRPGDRLRG